MIHVGYYTRPITNVRGTFYPIEEVIRRIREGHQKEVIEKLRGMMDVADQKRLKNLGLDYITFSAICETGYRDTKHIKQGTGVMSFDLAEVTQDLAELRTRLIEDPYITGVFLAPRGLDYKVLMMTEHPLEEYKSVYEAGRAYLLDKYGLKTDATSDAVRACFMSYDPQVYYNEDKAFFNRVKNEGTRVKREVGEIKAEITDGNRHTPLLELATKFANKLYLSGGKESLMTDRLEIYVWGLHGLYGRDDRRDTENIIRDARKYVLNNPPVTGKTRIGDIQKKNQEIISTKEAYRLGDELKSIIDHLPPIGIPEIDAYIKIVQGELYIISAETHVGKTLFSLQLAVQMARVNKKRILYISLESGYLIMQTVKKMAHNDLLETLSWYFPIEIITYEEIRKAVLSQSFDVVVIDHLHFTKPEKNATMGDTINAMVLDLQMLARERQIAIIAVCHLRKSQTSRDGNMPTLSDLKDTSSLAQVPSVVMLLYRQKSEKDNKTYLSEFGTLIIAKNRLGETGSIPFKIKDQQFTFGTMHPTIAAVSQLAHQKDEQTEVDDYPFNS